MQKPARKFQRCKFFPGELHSVAASLIAIFVLSSVTFSLAQDKPRPMSPKFGFVDYRLLLMAHPLMKKFRPDIKRFRDTASDFVLDKNMRFAELDEKISSATLQLSRLETKMKPLIKSGGEKARTAYSLFWKKRTYLEREIELLKKTRAETNIDGNYISGRTSENTLNPVADHIVKTVQDIVEDLRQKHELVAVIDISCLEDPPRLSQDQFNPPGNKHWEIWSGSNISFSEISGWLNSMDDSFFSKSFPQFKLSPFRAGMLDLREEGVRLLLEITSP